ncbi:hypothetical protein QJS04_geneDACA020771 [Acorus gramineus]|uniref:Uncharacterized protein n=1 Tax=Acorus gramineus TaxID=55184 RepID=A0AAV9A754_ACOGR|nr:hypothetical protein QJS04_geneDACA020771 [Acorus gramineus]
METKRTISLYCPTQSNLIIDFQTPKPGDEERGVDLGEVGRVFGLDPASVKLNGHFLSRGPDLVSRSVTWSSLLSYFSGRGFPDGRSVDRAVVVDGKPISQQKPFSGCDGEFFFVIVVCASRGILVNVHLCFGGRGNG